MILGLLAKVRALAAPPGGRVAHHSADPIAGPLGTPALHRVGAAPRGTAPTSAWDTDPATGEPLPAGAHLELRPDAFREARLAHRHGWLPALAHAGDPRAVDLLDSWLRNDIPGTGLAWAHASDLAARLVHWHAAVAWLSLPDSLAAALAGSAGWHCEHLRTRLPTGRTDGARRIAHFAGMVVGGLTFPAAPESRRAWSEGLSGLRFAVPGELFPDGAPRDEAPVRLAETLWYVALARAVARSNGIGFPTEAEGALARGARFLERLAGDLGELPAVGEAPFGDLLAAPGHPLAWSLCEIARHAGLDHGPATPAANDPRLAWLGLASPSGETEPAGKAWSMWSFRDGGIAVAHMRIKGRASRVAAFMGTPSVVTPHTHLAPLQVLWDVGDVGVLVDPGPGLGRPHDLAAPASHSVLLIDGHSLAEAAPAELAVARVDGRKARIEGHHRGWAGLGVPYVHHRDVLLNQQRLLITDRLVPRRRKPGRHAIHLSWQLGPGWNLTPDATGYIARQGDLTLTIQLPKGLAWTLHEGHVADAEGVRTAPRLVGDGGIDDALELTTSFEIR